MIAPGSTTWLLTGVTGFLGKVVLEELFRRAEELQLREVLVVIRAKGGRDASERFRKEVVPAKCFSGLTGDWASRVTVIDGDLAKPAWRDVPRSPRFVDMVSGEPALYDTRVASRWDAERFYVAYWIEEPQVKATLRERDSFIWNDDDVELFVAGDDCYYELEINAFGTVYEAFFVWQDALRRGSRFERAGFDPLTRNVDMPERSRFVV